MGDCGQRVLVFHTLIEFKSVVDELVGVEDRVELRTVWVIERCVDSSVNTCYEFVLLGPCDGSAYVDTIEVHMGVRRCGSFACCT